MIIFFFFCLKKTKLKILIIYLRLKSKVSVIFDIPIIKSKNSYKKFKIKN